MTYSMKRTTHASDTRRRPAKDGECNEARKAGEDRARELILGAFQRETPTKQTTTVVIDLTFLQKVFRETTRIAVPNHIKVPACQRAYRDGFRAIAGTVREKLVLLFNEKNREVTGSKPKNKWLLTRETLPEIEALIAAVPTTVEAAVEA